MILPTSLEILPLSRLSDSSQVLPSVFTNRVSIEEPARPPSPPLPLGGVGSERMSFTREVLVDSQTIVLNLCLTTTVPPCLRLSTRKTLPICLSDMQQTLSNPLNNAFPKGTMMLPQLRKAMSSQASGDRWQQQLKRKVQQLPSLLMSKQQEREKSLESEA